MVAGDYPRPQDAYGADRLLHSQQRGADLGQSHGSHAAYTAWKKRGVPTAQHESQQTFGVPTMRDQPAFGGAPTARDHPAFGAPTARDPPADQSWSMRAPPPQPQAAPASRNVSRGRNIISWEGETEEVSKRTTWDPLRREEVSNRVEEAPPGGSVSQMFKWRTQQQQQQQQQQQAQAQAQAQQHFGGQQQQQQQHFGENFSRPSLAGIENENPTASWGQLMATSRKRTDRPSAAMSMIDGLGSNERPPSDAPRLPADNMNYLGMRIPGQLHQSNRRSYAFTSQFSDPFL